MRSGQLDDIEILIVQLKGDGWLQEEAVHQAEVGKYSQWPTACCSQKDMWSWLIMLDNFSDSASLHLYNVDFYNNWEDSIQISNPQTNQTTIQID